MEKLLGIKIEVDGKKYQSDFFKASEVEIENTEIAIVKACSGKMDYFSIIINGNNVYFSKTKLINSVISSIIKENWLALK